MSKTVIDRVEWENDVPINLQLKTIVEEWREIDWKQVERRVYKLQKRIYRASSRGDVKVVRQLQKTLIRSWSAKVLAVRKVTQDNQGKKTAGVDGVKSLSPAARLRLTGQLKPGRKAKPARRVWIPKPGRDEKRPLGIPTMYDRALQALLKLALESEWEAKFEENSYGFRPGRSCHDAIGEIMNAIRYKPKFVLDADIAKCFDRINHGKLLEKLNTFPVMARQIRAWLKSGVLDRKEWFPTEKGTPQGGVISPLLANIALHGAEEKIKQYAETLKTPGLGKQSRRKSLSLIRYADDFVILHERLEVIQECQKVISEWLKDTGLELKPSKTRTAHTLKTHEQEPPGFDFLGFNIRQYTVGKHQSGKNTRGERLGFKTLIKPSKEKIAQHYREVADTITKYNTAPQSALISRLNSVIKGWSNYYSTVVSKETFSKLDNLVYMRLRRWGKRRHPNKSHKWVANKYWQSIKTRKWVFATKDGLRLTQYSDTSIVRHVKVKGKASPYDGDMVYWSSRTGKHPEMPKRKAKLLKAQKGKCSYCGHHFRTGDLSEEDHIVPTAQGGKNEFKNLQLLHKHCHDQKTAQDGSLGTHDKSQVVEEPGEGKLSRRVLKTSRGSDSPA